MKFFLNKLFLSDKETKSSFHKYIFYYNNRANFQKALLSGEQKQNVKDSQRGDWKQFEKDGV